MKFRLEKCKANYAEKVFLGTNNSLKNLQNSTSTYDVKENPTEQNEKQIEGQE